MHALLVKVEIDEGHGQEAQQVLESQIVPRVKQMPGVVSGVWLLSDDGLKGSSIVVFESEEAAKAAQAQAAQMPQPDFVHFGDVEVRQVSARF
jgi:hypothetical protein